MKDRTKIMFAEELNEMLKTMPLSKVRILDLCKRCGATPQTFYYHFKDKYELVAWIFLNDFADIYGDAEADYSPQRLEEIMLHMQKRKEFYQKAYAEHSQNSINAYIHDFDMQIARAAVKKSTGQETLTHEQQMAVAYHSFGVMGMFQDWIFSKSPMPASELAEFLYEKTPAFLRESFRQYEFSSKGILERAGNNHGTATWR